MKKNIPQDVIPPKKSIRNIELSAKKETSDIVSKKSPNLNIKREISSKEKSKKEEVEIKTEAPTSRFTPEVAPEKSSSYNYEYHEPKKSSRKFLYTSLVVLVIALVFGVSAFFKSAVIKITPEQETKTLDSNFTAKKDSVNDDLGFQVVTVNGSQEKNVSSTGQQKVDKKATGTVVLYNSYSTTVQKLVATTRLETPEGLIFRLVNAVTIPGRQTVNGKAVAGSVEATVVADGTGESYNVGLKDFTVVGFKSDPTKYAQIYARSKTSMTGGFSGMQNVVSQDVIDKTSSDLESSLRDTLSKNISSQIPENFVLYQNSISYQFDPVTQTDNGSGGVVLNKKGEASAVIFDKAVLTRNILLKAAPDLADDMIKINNLETLSFSFATGTSFDPDTTGIITFNLKGSPNLVWVIDENKLKTDLLGLSKRNATALISTYSTIKEAWIETQPFWSQTIPLDPKKVTLVNTLAQ